jgi:hypothetical protein
MSRQMVYTCDLPECEQLAPADGAIGWIEIATALELWLDWKRRNA